MLKYTVAICTALLSACNNYGPEDGEADKMRGNSASEVSQQQKPVSLVAVAYDMPPAVEYTMRCDLNSVAGVGLSPAVPTSVIKSGKVVFNGWVVDEGLAVPEEFSIILHNDLQSYAIGGVAGMKRPDVAEALGTSSALNSGFGFEADVESVSPGRYEVLLVVPETGAGCDTTKIIDIVDAKS